MGLYSEFVGVFDGRLNMSQRTKDKKNQLSVF